MGRWGWGLFLMVCVALMRPERADAKQGEPAVFDEARRTFEEGVARLDRQDAAGAIESFEHSLALRESLSALYNLGLASCLRRRKRGLHHSEVFEVWHRASAGVFL